MIRPHLPAPEKPARRWRVMRARRGVRSVGLAVFAFAASGAVAGPAAASTWTSPSLSICDHGNDLWQPFAPASGYQKPQYRMDAGGFIHLRGSVACAAAANDTQLFVLPKGFRPVEDEDWMVASGNGGGTFDAYPDIYINRGGSGSRSGKVYSRACSGGIAEPSSRSPGSSSPRRGGPRPP